MPSPGYLQWTRRQSCQCSERLLSAKAACSSKVPVPRKTCTSTAPQVASTITVATSTLSVTIATTTTTLTATTVTSSITTTITPLTTRTTVSFVTSCETRRRDRTWSCESCESPNSATGCAVQPAQEPPQVSWRVCQLYMHLPPNASLDYRGQHSYHDYLCNGDNHVQFDCSSHLHHYTENNSNDDVLSSYVDNHYDHHYHGTDDIYCDSHNDRDRSFVQRRQRRRIHGTLRGWLVVQGTSL
ncbi:hypothetical protein DE146DRAFT_769850 [Phaeosphaeria sp. MPI-PUGE-AT-0046c]|nr:hypothetical protein DE146DRAFT_769850 [Phaeosphaeria sp. MPI-PUGE-AT-0046c]